MIAPAPEPPDEIVVTTRIGLAEGSGDDLMLRYLVAECPWVSRPPKADEPALRERR